MSALDLWALVCRSPLGRDEHDHAVVGSGSERRLASRFDAGTHGAEYQRRERPGDVLVRLAGGDVGSEPFGFWLHGEMDDAQPRSQVEQRCELAARTALLNLMAAMTGGSYADAHAAHMGSRGRPEDLHGIQPLTCLDGSHVVVSWRWSARVTWDGRSTRCPAVRLDERAWRWWLLVVVDVGADADIAAWSREQTREVKP